MAVMMWAQVLEAPGRLEFRQIAVAECGQDEVLVRLVRSAICNGSDPPIYDGLAGYGMPLIFGHEPIGEIVECGKSVAGFKAGDRVSWWFSHGAFAEYVAVNPKNVAMVRVPEAIGNYEGPLVEPLSASGRAVWAAGVSRNDKVLILGLGPCGLIMAQWLRALGAAYVGGWEPIAFRRDKGVSLGIDHVYDPADGSVAKMTCGDAGEVDVIIDAMGNDALPGEPTMDRALQTLKRGGTVISFGHPANGRRYNPAVFQAKDASLKGPVQSLDKVRAIAEEGMSYVMSGDIRLTELITAAVPLSDVSEGIRLVRERPDQFLKVMVNIQ